MYRYNWAWLALRGTVGDAANLGRFSNLDRLEALVAYHSGVDTLDHGPLEKTLITAAPR